MTQEDKDEALSQQAFDTLRKTAQDRLTQLCAQDLGERISQSAGNAGQILVELRIKTELLAIDVNTLTIGLIAEGVLNQEKFLVTALRILQDRVKQLSESQSKIILARGKLS